MVYRAETSDKTRSEDSSTAEEIKGAREEGSSARRRGTGGEREGGHVDPGCVVSETIAVGEVGGLCSRREAGSFQVADNQSGEVLCAAG